MSKAVIFLADGMADNPLPELNGKTPLEQADTPAMDSIAREGASGVFLTLPKGFPTSSDAANMSVLGYELDKYYPGRGPIEAVSQGIKLLDDDFAWRCNLVHVDSNGVLLDYSSGHVDDAVSRRLMLLLQERFGSDKLVFHPGVSYRNLLVLRGEEFSARVDYHKPDSSQGELADDLCLTPLDDSHEARHTVEFLENLKTEAAAFLATVSGLEGLSNPPNWIWPWSPGKRPCFPAFKNKYAGKSGAIISAVDVVRGIGICAGMDVIDVPGATGYIDTNYEGKAQAALAALETHDFVYLHVEACDECSHMGDIDLKLRSIRDFDSRIVAPVMDALKGRDVTFAVLPDHPCPVKLRKHTRTPVPVAVKGPRVTPDGVTAFSERLALTGSLGSMDKDGLMRLVLGL